MTTTTATPTISKLEEIVSYQLEQRDPRDVRATALEARAAEAPRGFKAAIDSDLGLSVIAEIKRRSPSQGELRSDLNPAAFAQAYAAGGATCLSVLTNEKYFGGSMSDLLAARDACSLPVLRKDFSVRTLDVYDARRFADAVLIIVGAQDAAITRDLFQASLDVGVDALVEVHGSSDLEEALALGATLIGVNQRDLREMRLTAPDDRWAEAMSGRLPAGVTRVAMSGVRSRDDAQRLRDAGYDAVLVGETLVRSSDRAAKVAELRIG